MWVAPASSATINDVTIARGMPLRFVRLDAVHDWSQYENALSQRPLTRRYLGSTLRGWVEAQHMPLQVPWIAGMLEFGDAGVEHHLEQFESIIGSQALSELLADLFPKSSSREAGIQIQSFLAELIAARELQKASGAVKKAFRYADWEANGKRISVKTCLGPDFNYERLRNCLLGMMLVEENQTLRDCAHICLLGLVRANYTFMRSGLDFLEADFVTQLGTAVDNGSRSEGTSPPREACLTDGSRDSGHERLRVNLVQARKHTTGPLIWNVDCKQAEGELTVRLTRTRGDMIEIGTELDESDSPRMPREHSRALRAKIEENVGKMAKAFEQAPDGFQGWLDLPIHPLYEKYAAASPEFTSMVRAAIGQPGFPVAACIRGGFELSKPLILRF